MRDFITDCSCSWYLDTICCNLEPHVMLYDQTHYEWIQKIVLCWSCLFLVVKYSFPGRWVMHQMRHLLLPTHCQGHTRICLLFYAHLGVCSCRNFKDDYKWSETPSWNAYDTCQKLKGRRVLLIGDSTMSQLGSTLRTSCIQQAAKLTLPV